MTTAPDSSVPDLLKRARNGDETALGKVLEEHRAYLRLLSLRVLDGPLTARVDPSDIIQQTFLSAFKHFPNFAGDRGTEFLAWLVRIHERNLQDAVREHVLAEKRSVGNEQSFDNSVAVVDLRASSPSQRLLAGERAVHLAQVLEKLPADQREAVRLRHLEGFSLAEMAARLERSERAVAALLNRGMENLRKHMRPEG